MCKLLSLRDTANNSRVTVVEKRIIISSKKKLSESDSQKLGTHSHKKVLASSNLEKMNPSKTISELLNDLFPNKPADKKQAWEKTITSQEFDTVGDLARASIEAWNALDLPIAIKDALRQVVANVKIQPVGTAPKFQDNRPLTEVDVVVFDISSSMNSKSFDPLNTRLGMAKILFHNFADKLVAHELPHTLGMVTFGHNIHFMNFTRDFEAFNDVLGNADANENSTKLYDAIQKAGQEIINFREKSPPELFSKEEPPKFRIFCLTDGEDNSSSTPYWQVAKFLQENSILLDSIPLATKNSKLQSISVATGGLCLNVSEEQQGVALFEREAVLHVAKRDTPQSPLPTITNAASLEKLTQTITAVEDVKSALPKGLTGKVLNMDEITKLATQYDAASTATTTTTATTATTATTPVSTTNTTTNNSQSQLAGVKRILNEYRHIKATPAPGFDCFICADNTKLWKIIFDGPESTVYAGGRWMLSLQFPDDYPFKAPELRFCTPIYHMNVNKDGKVCMDILSSSFSPAITVSKILSELKHLIANPDPVLALDTVSANVYSDDRQMYFAHARDHTAQNATVSLAELKQKFQITD